MLMIQRPLDVVDSSIGHSTSFKYLQPLLSGLLLRKVLNQPIDFRSVLDTIAVGDEASIGLPLGESKSITQNTKQLVVPTTKQNISIKSLVASVGYNRGCARKSVYLGLLPNILGNENIRCAVPQRPESFCPLMSAELAKLDSVATWQSLRQASMYWPLPVRTRAKSAAMIAFEV